MFFLTLENPVFCCYLFWMSILVLKMLIMPLLTAVQRFRTQTWATPEDVNSKIAKAADVQFGNEHVERVRRAHRNDLELVVPFLIVALLYVATDPKPVLARCLFRIAALSRIAHTAVYAFRPVPQPARAITFFVTFAITFYMTVYVAIRTVGYI